MTMLHECTTLANTLQHSCQVHSKKPVMLQMQKMIIQNKYASLSPFFASPVISGK